MIRRLFFAALASIGLSTPMCSAARAQAVVVGAKEFTEQLLMAEMTVQLLQANGLSTHKGTGFATPGIRRLQESGVIDVYWEYTGTALTIFNGVTEKLDAAAGYSRVKALDAERGLVWLAPSKVNNTYALAMRRADAAARGIGTISDLAQKIRAGEVFKMASTSEFVDRSDGLKPLEKMYGFDFGLGNVVAMETGAVYSALRRAKDFDVAVVFATDGRIAAFDFVTLSDDRGFFPTYLLAPVARQKALERHPELASILEKLSTELDNEVMARLNAGVDVQRRTVEEVASDFLTSRGLLRVP